MKENNMKENNIKQKNIKSKSLLVLITIMSLFLSACGKKEWPNAILDQDRITISSLVGEIKNDTFIATIDFVNGINNIASLTLKLEAFEDCRTCPFQPTISKIYELRDKDFSQKGSVITLLYPNVNGKKAYKWQIIMENDYSTIEKLVSKVFILNPKTK